MSDNIRIIAINNANDKVHLPHPVLVSSASISMPIHIEYSVEHQAFVWFCKGSFLVDKKNRNANEALELAYKFVFPEGRKDIKPSEFYARLSVLCKDLEERSLINAYPSG